MKKCFGMIFISLFFISAVIFCTSCGKKAAQDTTKSTSYSKHGSSDYLKNISEPETVNESVLERITGLAEGVTGLAEESDIEPEYNNSQGDANFIATESHDIVDIARNLLNCLNVVEILNGCCLETDSSKKIKYGNYYYQYVTDENFQSLDEIKSFLYTYFTDSFINTECYYILGLGNKGYYIEVKEGVENITPGLYQMINDNGYYVFDPNQAIVVSHSDEPKFSATTSFYDEGIKYKLLYKCILDGSWKVDKKFISKE